MIASVGGSPVPRTQLLDVDVNPMALINYVDDAPPGQARMVGDATQDATMRPYRHLAYAIISQALAEIARKATQDLDAALEALQGLSISETWGLWCGVLKIDEEVLCEAVARRLASGDPLKIPRFYMVRCEADE
jgi:hypothetical protein